MKYFTTTQAAGLLNTSNSKVIRLIEKFKLKVKRTGKRKDRQLSEKNISKLSGLIGKPVQSDKSLPDDTGNVKGDKSGAKTLEILQTHYKELGERFIQKDQQFTELINKFADLSEKQFKLNENFQILLREKIPSLQTKPVANKPASKKKQKKQSWLKRIFNKKIFFITA